MSNSRSANDGNKESVFSFVSITENEWLRDDYVKDKEFTEYIFNKYINSDRKTESLIDE